MSETRKLAAILVSDVFGYSRLAGADEDRISGAAAMAKAKVSPVLFDLSPALALELAPTQDESGRDGCVKTGPVS